MRKSYWKKIYLKKDRNAIHMQEIHESNDMQVSAIKKWNQMFYLFVRVRVSTFPATINDCFFSGMFPS